MVSWMSEWKRTLLTEGRRVNIFALTAGANDEVVSCIKDIRQENAGLASSLYAILQHVADNFPNVTSSWLKPIPPHRGLWEILKKRLRFYGFLHSGNLYLCRYNYKAAPKADRRILASVVKIQQAWKEINNE